MTLINLYGVLYGAPFIQLNGQICNKLEIGAFVLLSQNF